MMGRPRARFCKRGHDTHVTGRDSGGTCRQCRVLLRERPASLTLAEVERDVQEMRARVAQRRKVMRVA